MIKSQKYQSVQFSLSVVSNSLRPHGLQQVRPPCPSPTPSLLKLMSIESVMPFNNLILCGPLLLSPSIFPSIRVFSKESVLCIRWPKYWSFTSYSCPSSESVFCIKWPKYGSLIFSISPSNEHSGLIKNQIH